jgi:nucleoside-diphosphate-sugar epimerase
MRTDASHSMTSMSRSRTILITGAAGNLGGLLARHLVPTGDELRLMYHRRPIDADTATAPNVTPVQADLGRPDTLEAAVAGVDVVVHFAGVLFAPRPEQFLPTTNAVWFRNLMTASIAAGVKRVILISFPHVAEGTTITPVVLRLGMVYGRGILMVDTARWLAERGLLGVWRDPTWIQLISTSDFLSATAAAARLPGIEGIYHVGDEEPVTLQRFLDCACEEWGARPPWRMPIWLIFLAASMCEVLATMARRPSPLTRDFIRIGRVSYWGDTRRLRAELCPELAYTALSEGACTL